MSVQAEQLIANIISQIKQINDNGALLWVTDPNPNELNLPVSETYTGTGGLWGRYSRAYEGEQYNELMGKNVPMLGQSWHSTNIGSIMGAFMPTAYGYDLNGGEMTDILLGSFAAPDKISGNAGNDVIFGAGGPDVIHGDAGNDFLVAGITPHINMTDYCGRETFTAKYNFVPLMYKSVIAGQFDYAHNDALNIPHSELYGGTGDDTLIAGVGNDSLYGGDGADTILGGEGNDTIYGDGANSKGGIGNNGGADYIMGEEGNDILDGGIGNDTLLGGAGDDSVSGGIGNDQLDGGAGADAFDGGAGVDVVTYASATAAIVLNLGYPNENAGDAFGDIFTGVEAFIGSGQNDIMFGAASSDEFYGGLGKDTLYGGGANDFLFGGNGDDVYFMNSASNQDQVYEFSSQGTDIVNVLDDVADLSIQWDNANVYLVGNGNTCLTVLMDWFAQNGSVEYLQYQGQLYSIAGFISQPTTISTGGVAEEASFTTFAASQPGTIQVLGNISDLPIEALGVPTLEVPVLA